MDKKLKRKWVAALRGGKFKQTIGALEKVDVATHKVFGNCCLGVLCRLENIRAFKPDHDGDVPFGNKDETGMITVGRLRRMGITQEQARQTGRHERRSRN